MSELHPNILVIEDDPTIRYFVRLTLEGEGHTVYEAETLKRGLIDAGTRRPDLVVLDLGLPDGDGVTFIREFRNWSPSPVIVLSARSAESDKVDALDAGADDYLVKPFGAGELTARVRAQLRRHLHQAPSGDSVIHFGEFELDLVKRQLTHAGDWVHLTPIEYKLLSCMAGQPDRVITHSQLLKAVWGPGHGEDTHYVRVHMANLRKKVEPYPSMPKHLLTEVGVGYRFKLS